MGSEQAIKVLVCPLNWGIGHATRCVPVIRSLVGRGFRVVLAADGRSMHFLMNEFPDLEFIRFSGFSPRYPYHGSMALKMLASVPAFVTSIFREHHQLKEIVSEHHIGLVISDNRYGLWHRQVKSVIMIHQVMIKTPGFLRWAEPLLYFINRLMISRFHECWIPDFPGVVNLSGDLSHKYPLPSNARFIGGLSRFEPGRLKPGNTSGALVALLSGPEPQRTILENILIKKLRAANIDCIVISGKTEAVSQPKTVDGITIIPHLPTGELENMLRSAPLVICRPGYSSIMDLAAIGKKALFIPTPGQTEQEYLASFHEKQGTFYYAEQRNFDLEESLHKASGYSGISSWPQESLLMQRIDSLALLPEEHA
ncbi:MAG TPA: glycosyltransferase [Bacteroidales bacterium]|nr:glycosyltransferase [Bacteroidales bacterium]